MLTTSAQANTESMAKLTSTPKLFDVTTARKHSKTKVTITSRTAGGQPKAGPKRNPVCQHPPLSILCTWPDVLGVFGWQAVKFAREVLAAVREEDKKNSRINPTIPLIFDQKNVGYAHKHNQDACTVWLKLCRQRKEMQARKHKITRQIVKPQFSNDDVQKAFYSM